MAEIFDSKGTYGLEQTKQWREDWERRSERDRKLGSHWNKVEIYLVGVIM